MAKRYRLPKDVVARITKTVQATEAYCAKHPDKKLQISFSKHFLGTRENIALRDELIALRDEMQGYLDKIPRRLRALLIKYGTGFVMKDKDGYLAVYNSLTNSVLLSSSLLQMSPEERKMALVHEIAHRLSHILGQAITAPRDLHKETNVRRRRFAARFLSEKMPVSMVKNAECAMTEYIFGHKLFSNTPYYMKAYLKDLETRAANKDETKLEDFYDRYAHPAYSRKEYALTPHNAIRCGAEERFAVSLERLLAGSNQVRKLEEKWKHTGTIMLCVLAALAGEEKAAVKSVAKPVARRPVYKVVAEEKRLAA